MADGDPHQPSDDLGEADPLEVELAELTSGWSMPDVVRSYRANGQGQEAHRDEAELFEEHGYVLTLSRERDALTGTFRKITVGDATRAPDSFIRIYEGEQQRDAVALFEEDAADLSLDDFSPVAESWAAAEPGEPGRTLSVTYARLAVPAPVHATAQSDETAAAFCVNCGTPRLPGALFCGRCGRSFGAAAKVATAPAAATAETISGTDPGQLMIGAGIAWIVAAAASGYLALLQLNGGNELNAIGFDGSGLLSDAAFNGVGAILTVYFGARLIMRHRGLLSWSVGWAVLSVLGVGYEIATGLTNAELILSAVAAAIAGILSFVAYRELPR